MHIQQATELSRDYRRQLLTAIADGTKTTEKHLVVKGELICLKKEPTIREQLAAIAELNRMDKEDRDMQREADKPAKAARQAVSTIREEAYGMEEQEAAEYPKQVKPTKQGKPAKVPRMLYELTPLPDETAGERASRREYETLIRERKEREYGRPLTIHDQPTENDRHVRRYFEKKLKAERQEGHYM
jgi:hypothetical protein